MFSFLLTAGKFLLSALTGGSLAQILKTVDQAVNGSDNADAIKADVIKTWITAEANLLVGRTWWFQLFFVIPLGIWWSSVIFDSITHIHTTSALPPPLDTWAAWIISALFMIDGSKAVLGRLGFGK